MARRKFKMTRSFWLRLMAVAIFVGLGTFAVVHSMNKKENGQADLKSDNETGDGKANDLEGDQAGVIQPMLGDSSSVPIVSASFDDPIEKERGITTEPPSPLQSKTPAPNTSLTDQKSSLLPSTVPPGSSPGNSKSTRNSNQGIQAKLVGNSGGFKPPTQQQDSIGPPIQPPGPDKLLNNLKEKTEKTGEDLRDLLGNSKKQADRVLNPINPNTNTLDPSANLPKTIPPAQNRRLGDRTLSNSQNINTNSLDTSANPKQDSGTLNIPPILVKGNDNPADKPGTTLPNNKFNVTQSKSTDTTPRPLRDDTTGNFRNNSTAPGNTHSNHNANARTFNDGQTQNTNQAPMGRQLPNNRQLQNNRQPLNNNIRPLDVGPGTTQNSGTVRDFNRATSQQEKSPTANGQRQFNTELNSNSLGPTNNSLNNSLPGRQPPVIQDNTRRNIPTIPVSNTTISNNKPGSPANEGAQAPSLLIEKNAPREIQVNRPATFEVIVRNNGRVVANQVQVYDQVPQGTRLVEAQPKPTTTRGSELIWNLGTIEPGQERRIKMNLIPLQPGEIGSVAQVTFAAAASVRTVCTKPELELSASAPPKVLIGRDVIVDIEVHNTGNGVAESVVVQEDVPDGLEFTGGLKELEYPVGSLKPGERRKIQLRLKATKVGNVRNLMVAHAKGNLRTTKTVDVEIVAPRLVTNGQGPSRRFVDREATHQFTVSNTGTATATNLQMVAKLPRGLKYKSSNNKGRYIPQNHSVFWKLDALQPGQTGRIEITTVPIEKGEQTIDFQVNGDLNQSGQNKQSLVVQQIVEVFFDIDDLNDAIEVGSPTSYELRVKNQGATVANNVQLRVDFPPAIKPIRVQNGKGDEVRNQQIVFPAIPRLAPGQELRFVIDAQGIREGDHLVVASLKTDDRTAPISKEESTRVYSDR